MQVYRQGDVCIIKLPESAKVDVSKEALPVDPDKGVVLAFGEVTGHAHSLDAAVCALYDGEPLDGQSVEEMLAQLGGGLVPQATDRVLDVRRSTFLAHDEHDPIQLEEGVYVVRRQREYDPEAEHLVED